MSNAIFAVAVALALTIIISGESPPVPADDLLDLAKQAEQVSPEASELLKVFLAENQTPSKGELRPVQRAIEQAATAKAAGQITGQPGVADKTVSDLLAKTKVQSAGKQVPAQNDDRLRTAPLSELSPSELVMVPFVRCPGKIVAVLFLAAGFAVAPYIFNRGPRW
jgi:hypothetical protein